ncbi:MAG: hypothetical protein IAE77_11025 [Prosthecobacter sp.]|nr:hypothetical protein [Prosthecobacter sp.]
MHTFSRRPSQQAEIPAKAGHHQHYRRSFLVFKTQRSHLLIGAMSPDKQVKMFMFPTDSKGYKVDGE